MKLIYGTGNPAKAAAMQNRIAGLGIELISAGTGGGDP